jgi:uncharacterized protein
MPGWQDSGPDHWQSHWERAHPQWRRLHGLDWDTPTRDGWVAGLDAALREIGGSVVLACHSLGCHTAAAWVSRHGAGPVRAALLVTPPDLERADMPPEIQGFTPLVLRPLPFPSVLVTSDNDEWCQPERSAFFAKRWGSRHLELGSAGHINADAGFGPWSEGEALLAELLAGCE